jgi:hypothetical protein
VRIALAIAAGLCMAVMAWLVGRADAGIGAPLGAERRLEAIDAADLPPDAAAQARQVLRERPADGRAYRILGQVAEAEGDAARADALYAIAVKRWPRERYAQSRLAALAFLAGRPAEGMEHLDALMRVAPHTAGDILASLMPAMADPALRAAMVQRLRLDPPWRAAVPEALQAPSTPAGAALALLSELAAAGPLGEGEVQARVALLDRQGRPADARATWLASLAPEARAGSELLFDGGFEHPEATGGYGWRYRAPPGVAMGIDHRDPLDGEGAMTLTFSGRAVRFDDLAQFLALAPGDYVLHAAADNRVRTGRPFVWRLRCASDGRLLGDVPLVDRIGWEEVSGSFRVPPDCPRQELRLRHDARSLAERQLRGVLRLDGMAITHSP